MFYRRKYYQVTPDFVEPFNQLFNEINLPNQLRQGTRLIGRWSCALNNGLVEVFAIWEYDSKEQYERIEARIRSDKDHVERIRSWYAAHGGRELIYRDYIKVRNEEIHNTVVDSSLAGKPISLLS